MVMGDPVNRVCCCWEMLHRSSQIYSREEDVALGGGRHTMPSHH